MSPERLPSEGQFAWVRDSSEVKKRWQAGFDYFNRMKELGPEKSDSIPAEVEFFEIPQQLYDALPNLSEEDLPKVAVLLQQIESFPYAQKGLYDTLRKMKGLVVPSKIKEQHLQYYEEELQSLMVALCSNAVRLEEVSAELKNSIDRLLVQANTPQLYNEPDVYAKPAEQPVWDMAGSAYSILPSYTQRAVDRITSIYETGQPVSREEWDKYFNSSNLVNFAAIVEPKEKCATFVVALNNYGGIKNNRRDSRIPVLPEK